jgi:hypothetical protein
MHVRRFAASLCIHGAFEFGLSRFFCFDGARLLDIGTSIGLGPAFCGRQTDLLFHTSPLGMAWSEQETSIHSFIQTIQLEEKTKDKQAVRQAKHSREAKQGRCLSRFGSPLFTVHSFQPGTRHFSV